MSIGMMADFDEDTWNEDTDAFYSSGVRGANHAVNIVGWDDHFPKERFAGQPAAAGAWIVRNGWGTVFGEEGDFCSAWTGFPVLSSALARIRAMENTAFREVRLSSTRSAPSKKTSSPCVGRRCPYEAASFGKVLPRRFAFFREDLISFLPDWRNK